MISKIIGFFFASIMLGVTSGLIIGFLVVASKPEYGSWSLLWAPVLMVFFFFFLISTLYGIYVSVYIRRYYYDALEQFLTIQKGVFAPTEIHVPYGKIQDVYVDQDILDRIMGLYDVHISSATITSGIEAHIDGVDARVAEELKNFLLNKIQHGSQVTHQEATISQHQTSSAVVLPGPKAGMFNSKNYPIVGAWYLTAGISNILVAGWYTFCLVWILTYFGKRMAIIDELTMVGLSKALVIYGIIYIMLMIWAMLWKKTFSFEFLPQFIQMKEGVIQREEKHVPYRTLQNVLLKRNIIERMLGLSTVVIENAAMENSKFKRASHVTIPGQPLAKGNELVNELNKILGHTSGQGTGL